MLDDRVILKQTQVFRKSLVASGRRCLQLDSLHHLFCDLPVMIVTVSVSLDSLRKYPEKKKKGYFFLIKLSKLKFVLY